jgi:hypothetical protein
MATIECAECGIKNRVGLSHANQRPICGKCGVPLAHESKIESYLKKMYGATLGSFRKTMGGTSDEHKEWLFMGVGGLVVSLVMFAITGGENLFGALVTVAALFIILPIFVFKFIFNLFKK